jgi:hypothetical protein
MISVKEAIDAQLTAGKLSPRRVDSDATRDNQLGRQALRHLVSLIARQASHSGDPSIAESRSLRRKLMRHPAHAGQMVIDIDIGPCGLH